MGIAGDLAMKDEMTMKRLFLLDFLRGPDSTGMAAIRNNGDVRIAKVPSNPVDLFDMGRFKEALNGNLACAFIGHNRAATRGAVTHGNTHPFEVDHIVGAHNGTLDASSHDALEAALGERFTVDSQAIIAAIARFGLKEAVSMMSGAWSLVYFDRKDGTLNMLRNKERPMWYAYTDDFKKLFWASEWPMIDAAVRLTGGYKLFRDEETGYQFWSTGENIHYAWDVGKLRAGSKERPKPLAKLVEGKPDPVVTYSSDVGTKGGLEYDPFERRGNQNGSGKNKKTHGLDTLPLAIIHLIGDVHDPFGGAVEKERFDDLAKYGCSFCQGDVSWDDVGVTIFDRDDGILCPACSDNISGQSRVYKREITVQ